MLAGLKTDCKLVDSELDRHFAERASPLSPQAQRHLEECERCRRLYDDLSAPLPSGSVRPEVEHRIIQTIQSSLNPDAGGRTALAVFGLADETREPATNSGAGRDWDPCGRFGGGHRHSVPLEDAGSVSGSWLALLAGGTCFGRAGGFGVRVPGPARGSSEPGDARRNSGGDRGTAGGDRASVHLQSPGHRAFAGLAWRRACHFDPGRLADRAIRQRPHRTLELKSSWRGRHPVRCATAHLQLCRTTSFSRPSPPSKP
jgi:hypothetical protein